MPKKLQTFFLKYNSGHLRCSTLSSSLRNLLTITVQAPHPEILMLEHLHNSSLFRISKEWLVSTKSSFVKLCDCVWCYLSPPSPQPSLVPHNLSFVLNDEIGSFLAVFIGNTIKRHHSCHCRWSPLLDMSIRIRILLMKWDCQSWNQTKIDKRRKKGIRNRKNLDPVASILKLLADTHLLSPLASTGNCLPQESEQGSGRVRVFLYHLACCWFHNCLRQKNNFFIREGVKKKRLFLGKSPKQRTPPTHRYSLGLT